MTCFVKFDVRVHEYVTREANPDDEWDNGSTDASVNIGSAALVERDSYDCLPTDEELKVGDVVFLVWAKYGTGDSFGSYGGKYELLDVTKDSAKATERAKFHRARTDYGAPWIGYFEWLDDIYVEAFTLKGKF
jgi:hypothetical protein